MAIANDQQRRLVAQLSLFKERLLDLDSRNVSLLLRREVQARSFDLAKLGPELAGRCYERLSGQAAIRLTSATDTSPTALQQRRHLQVLTRAAKARAEETGLQDLYLGIGFLTGHVAPDSYLRAPLLLVPAQLQQVTGGREAGFQLQLDPEQIVLNEAIAGAVRKHRAVRLPEDLAEQVLQALRGEQPVQPEQSDQTQGVQQRLFAALQARLGSAGLPLLPYLLHPATPLRALTADTLPSEQTPLTLSCELVVGLFPQSSSALHADLEALAERASGGELNLGIVDNLLEVPADLVAPLDSRPEAQLASADEVPEAAVQTVVACDPSQHHVLALAQTAECLVVRGPPGTGKSQVIVNLVADAMARGRRVLVVCQKRAALDVVYRRLSEVGLSASAALVHDAAADRAELYKRLAAQLQAEPSPRLQRADPATLAREIDELVRRIRALVEPLGSERHGLPLFEIYAKAQHGFRPVLAPPSAIVGRDFSALEQTCQLLDQAKPGYLRFDVTSYPLALRSNWAALGHVESAELQRAWQALHAEAAQGGLVARVPSAAIGQQLLAQLAVFTQLRDRWYRWLLPRFWRARAALDAAVGFFGGVSRDAWRDLLERHGKVSTIFEAVAGTMQSSFRKLHEGKLIDLSGLAAIAAQAGSALGSDLPALRSHDRLRAALGEQALPLLAQCAEQLAPSDAWGERVQQEVLLRWIDEAQLEHPRLADTLGEEHRQLRAELLQKLAQRRETVAQALAAELAARARTPSFDPAEAAHPNRKPSTDWNKLAHELGKKRMVKPLRVLLSEHAWPMKQLVRCWLASPEVVAEVFPLERACFDLVIFDEASQLTLERALAVLYRGAQLVIAGDEQQMPPSDFFSSSTEDEPDEELVGTAAGEARFAESLLSQAKRVYGFRYLAWHYRSQYQQLIEFSNHAFYDGALQIAANVDTLSAEPPIRFIPVQGQWLEQTNVVEVQRAVDELLSLLREHQARPRSVGIITFNQKQQEAILDEIEARRANDPELEALYSRAEASANLDERPFVKNIENVQGDERDYIIFSVGYARGADGVLRKSFGPLNLQGGENRLNVAITRAKRGARVICSFDPDTLDVQGSKHRGPLLLKQFLQYARAVSDRDVGRIEALLTQLNPERRATTSPADGPRFASTLARQLYDALTARGLTVHPHWGAGGYHIDLAVVDPKDPSRLCLGIECDGASYHGVRSVRERDLSRQAFLESRGWTIRRVWSRDWWSDPDAVLAQIVAQLPARA